MTVDGGVRGARGHRALPAAWRRLLPLLVLLAAILPYLNSLRGGFVWDDTLLILDNRHVKDWRFLPDLLAESMGAGTSQGRGDVYGFYRPLPMLTFMADYALHGLDPLGYHLTNLAIHALTGLALFRLVTLLFADAALALVTALLFVAHPVNTEVVSYVSGRDTGLAALLLLACCSFYVSHLRRPRAVSYAAALACFALSLLSKELAAAAPLLLLVCEVALARPAPGLVRRLAPFVLVDVVWVAAKFTVLTFPGAGVRGQQLELSYRFTGFLASLAQYARLALLPGNQHVDYGLVHYGFSSPPVLAGIGLLAAAILLAVALPRRSSATLFALAWLALNLAPYCGVVPTNAYMAEHWFVVPLAGACLLVAAGAIGLVRRFPAARFAVVAGLAVAVLALGARTAAQNRYWADPETFYAESIRLAPRPHLAEWHYNLGNHRLRAGDHAGALQAYASAIESDSGFSLAYHNSGVVFDRTGQYAAAEQAFRSALRLDPRNPLTLRNLAFLADRRGDHQTALALLGAAARLTPGDPEIAAEILEFSGR